MAYLCPLELSGVPLHLEVLVALGYEVSVGVGNILMKRQHIQGQLR